MSDDNPKSVSRSATRFLSGTFLSRLTGMFRDVSMAFCFGSHPAIAAFMVAFRFANLVRRLFGEGPLASSFIPHFESMRAESPSKGAQFFRDTFHSLLVFLVGIILFSEMVLFLFLKWGSLQPDNAQIVTLTMLMLPGILFVCLYGLSSGLLQCEKNFFTASFAPVAFNVVWIGAVWGLKDRAPSQAMVWLSSAVVLAFGMQWVMTVPKTLNFLKKFLSPAELFRGNLFSTQMRGLAKPVFLSIMGVGAVQINSALDGIFARYASLEGPAYLWYAIRIEQLPLALFGLALSSALLPALSRKIKAGAMEEYFQLLRFALKRTFSLIFPCTIGIFVLGAASVNLLYGRGDFNVEATFQTVTCLWGYGIGLLPAVFVLLFAPAFYAQKDFRTPMFASVLAVAVNSALNSLMVFGFKWGTCSIAVATSIAALINFYYLSHRFSKKMGSLLNFEVIRSFAKTGVCALIAGATTLALGHFLVNDPTLQIFLGKKISYFPRDFSVQLLQFFALTGFFGLIFFSYAWMLNAEDLLQLIGIKKKIELKSQE